MKEYKIKFYKPDNIILPTTFSFLANDKHIYYERLNNDFGFVFKCYQCTLEEATDVVKQAASIMCEQSYDHGAEWRVCSITTIKIEQCYVCIEVKFKWHDVY